MAEASVQHAWAPNILPFTHSSVFLQL